MKRLAALLAFCAFACGDDGASSSGDSTSTGAGAGPASSSASGATTGSGTGGDASGGGGGTGGQAATLSFPAAWPDGTNCAAEDPLFVHELADDLYVLRQSLCTSFEGPFLYLLLGSERAILFDTGDGGIPLQQTVQGLVEAYATRHGLASLDLVVAHSHAHGDHTAGDGQFAGEPNTTVVGTGTSAVQSFFGFASPDDVVEYDLGGRVLDVMQIPGHQAAHVAVYDRKYQLLFTGDTLYPGRLYIQVFSDYVDSIGRMVQFVNAGNDVAFVLGTHIEMTTTPGDDFPFGASEHPNEHVLQLSVDHLLELDTAVKAMGNSPVLEVHDDFIIYPQ